jgi:hypothetical protein
VKHKPKRKPKLSRLAIQALRDAGIESSWTEAGGPGDFSSDLFSWIEEQNIINRAIAASLRRGRGANKKADALAIWQEFKRRRPSSGSRSAHWQEIHRLIRKLSG